MTGGVSRVGIGRIPAAGAPQSRRVIEDHDLDPGGRPVGTAGRGSPTYSPTSSGGPTSWTAGRRTWWRPGVVRPVNLERWWSEGRDPFV